VSYFIVQATKICVFVVLYDKEMYIFFNKLFNVFYIKPAVLPAVPLAVEISVYIKIFAFDYFYLFQLNFRKMIKHMFLWFLKRNKKPILFLTCSVYLKNMYYKKNCLPHFHSVKLRFLKNELIGFLENDATRIYLFSKKHLNTNV